MLQGLKSSLDKGYLPRTKIVLAEFSRNIKRLAAAEMSVINGDDADLSASARDRHAASLSAKLGVSRFHLADIRIFYKLYRYAEGLSLGAPMADIREHDFGESVVQDNGEEGDREFDAMMDEALEANGQEDNDLEEIRQLSVRARRGDRSALDRLCRIGYEKTRKYYGLLGSKCEP